MVLVDKAGQYYRSVATKTKSGQELGSAIVKIIKKLQTSTRKALKHFQTDGAGELSKRVVKEVLHGQGTEITTTIANFSDMNGSAERAIRTLKESVLSALNAANTPKTYWNDALTG